MGKYYPVVALKFRSCRESKVPYRELYCFIHTDLIFQKILVLTVYESHVHSTEICIPSMKFQDGGQSQIIKHSLFVARSILVALHNNAMLGTYAIDRKIENWTDT